MSDDDLHILGMISTQYASETHRPRGPVLDKTYVGVFARAHEYAGFDRVLIGYFSNAPDGFQVAAYAAQQTSKLKFLLAHRPGFTAPTLAARQLASLDQFSDGRLAVHIISGGSDEEQQRDGDFLSKAERYARTDDYLDVLKKTWTSERPFDHDGPYYRVKGAFASVRPAQKPHIPIFFGGASDEAIEVAGRHAETYALFGETLEQARETIAKVRASAARHGREGQVRFSLSLRPILGDSEEGAWARAEQILEDAKALRAAAPNAVRWQNRSEAQGAQRLLAAAAGGKVRDKRLWTEIAELTGAQGNSTSLVGTGEQVTDALLDYYDLGITTFLFRGFDPLEDALDYGRRLLPLFRRAVADRRGARHAAE
jgi:alkanesulfonate monooxygenase